MLLSPAISVDASLDSLQHVSGFLMLLSPNPDITFPMCPYKGQREEITISLNVLAMILKQYVGVPSLLQRHTASLHSTCSAWGPPSHVLQGCFHVSQPSDFVLHGLIMHHIVYIWLKLVSFVAVYFSSMLRSLWKTALLSAQQVVHSSLVWIWFWHTHVKLQVITYRKIHQSSTDPRGNVIHNWLPVGFHWTCQSSHLTTHFVFNTFSWIQNV